MNLEDDTTIMHTRTLAIKDVKICTVKGCEKKPVVISMRCQNNTLDYELYCKEHLKQWAMYRNYKYDNHCNSCFQNFLCNIQKLLFTKKELKQYKRSKING